MLKRLTEKTLKCFKETDNVEIRHNGGRKRSIRLKQFNKMCSRKNSKKFCTIFQKNFTRLKIDKKYGWIKQDLKLKTYKKMTVHGLTEKNKV